MGRLALCLALIAAATPVQQVGVVHITVTIVDAEGRVRPVPRHALLISDNPVSAAPQRVVTSIEGTAEVRLSPGSYTIESDEPLIFQAKAYEWSQTVNVAAGRDIALALTAANAEVGTPIALTGDAGAAPGSASAILLDWQDSVVSIWSPTRLGSGFVIDARGLIATNQRLVGKAIDVEIQLSAVKKVPARVLASDADKDVAILWTDPSAIAAVRPMKLGARDGPGAVNEKDKLYAIEAPLDDRKSLSSGTVSKVTAHAVVTNINLDERSAGTPLLNGGGEVVAVTTLSDDGRTIPDVAQAAIRVDDVRAVIAEAEKKMATLTPPPPAPLPIEPERPFDDDALKEAVKRRGGNLGAYQIGAENFDVSVITPVMLYGARHRDDRERGRERGGPAGNPEELLKAMRAVQDFANWDDYVFDYPPVVMIRVTPKMVEGFWTSLARGAAQTQGVSIPSIKHLKTTFGRMRLRCGEADITPIHPFRIEQRVGEREFVYEGLYVFAPDALSPQCKTVTLTLYSEKEPDKGDARIVDPKILQQVWDDFAPYRAAK